MKQILFIFILLALVSCKSNFALEGNYKKVGSDFSYSLKLNKDSTFIVSKKYFEVNATCEGKWKVKQNEILLTCDDPKTLAEQLQTGYINDRNMTLQIVGSNKLKFGKVIIRKVK